MPLELNPFYSIAEGINDEIFDECQLDPLSLTLIEKGAVEYRFAYTGWVKREHKILPVSVRPGLRSTANDEDINTAKKVFDDHFVIAKDQASSAGIGVVHRQTSEQCETLNPGLRGKLIGQIGASFVCNYWNGIPTLLWTARSAMNLTVFKFDPLAMGCFMFSPQIDSLSIVHVNFSENIKRTIPSPHFFRIMKSTSKQLAKPSQYGKNELEEKVQRAFLTWEEMRKMEEKQKVEKISSMLSKNLYLASLLPRNKNLNMKYIRNRNGYELKIKEIIQLKKQYNLPINIDAIPSEFKVESNNSTALMMAARQGYLSIADLLLQNDANIHAKDSDGNTSLYVAVLYKQLEMVQFLLSKGASFGSDISVHKHFLLMNKIQLECINIFAEYQSLIPLMKHLIDTDDPLECKEKSQLTHCLALGLIELANNNNFEEINAILNLYPNQSFIKFLAKKFLEENPTPRLEKLLFQLFEKSIKGRVDYLHDLPLCLINHFVVKKIATFKQDTFFYRKKTAMNIFENKISLIYLFALYGVKKDILFPLTLEINIKENIKKCNDIFTYYSEQKDNKLSESKYLDINDARFFAIQKLSMCADEVPPKVFARKLRYFKILDCGLVHLRGISEQSGICEMIMETYLEYANAEEESNSVLENLIQTLRDKEIISLAKFSLSNSVSALQDFIQQVKEFCQITIVDHSDIKPSFSQNQ
jgi:hypothetical protein